MAADFIKENAGGDVEIIVYPGITHMIPDEATEKASADIKKFIG